MISDTIKIDQLKNDQLKNSISDTLQNKGYKTDINALTDDSIEMYVSYRGLETKVSVNRNRHTPYIITLRVDSNHLHTLKQISAYRKRQSGGEKNKDNSYYRYYFYFLIISTIGSFIYIALNTLFPTIEGKIGFLASIFMLIIIYFSSRRFRDKNMKQTLHKFDEGVFISIINSLKIDELENKKEKCWNCFQEKSFGDAFCQNCGK